jgi:hypothetical protein
MKLAFYYTFLGSTVAAGAMTVWFLYQLILLFQAPHIDIPAVGKTLLAFGVFVVLAISCLYAWRLTRIWWMKLPSKSDLDGFPRLVQ